jgi:gluconate 2-dehydrogenase gamma chain
MPRRVPQVVLTRRQFAVAGALSSAGAMIGCRDGAGGNWDFLSDRHARLLAVLCDQIIPADDFPSASQAGVVAYIDRQLARHYRTHQAAYQAGLEEADALNRVRFRCGLVDATPEQQRETVAALEKNNRVFFELLREHTMEGFYGSPRHGGNRDAVSWRMLGLPEPPLRGRAQYDLRKGDRS